jgi:hypothetical protein
VEADLWDQLPADLEDLLTLVPGADLYLQNEMQVAFHPTLTRLWSRKGRRGNECREAPGDNRKVYGFGRLYWRDGWFDGRVAPGRTADVFWKPSPCRCGSFQTARTSGYREGLQPQDAYLGWVPARARAGLTELSEHLRLVYTPDYDPDANRHSMALARLATGGHT